MQDHGSLDHNVVAPVRVLSGRFWADSEGTATIVCSQNGCGVRVRVRG